ncbi:MAG: hypothetical protein K2N78_00125 [Oscillospiraceae bacterium]|nr:hypothetical protein [Oscillospiraceae bacterium]
MFEQIPLLAAAITTPTEAERPLLAALCTAAIDEVTRKLRPGLTAADCGDAFLCAAAMTAAAGLMSCRSSGDVEQFSAGDVSLRSGSGGDSCKAASMLRHAAEMMESYWADGSFAFTEVKG